MIFGLPALIGFLPLVIYLYLAFKGKNLLSTVIICVLVGAVLTGQTPVSLSNEIANGLKSFLGLIGFIIMMGAGLGEVLTETKVARNLVEILIKKVGIKKSESSYNSDYGSFNSAGFSIGNSGRSKRYDSTNIDSNSCKFWIDT